jgi:sec-independent protein translocase protein TatB
MAADFQGQFQEAMREAEMADLKKQVDDIAQDVKNYDPLKDVRADVEAAGKDIQTSLEQKPALMTAAASDAVPQPAAALPIADAAGELREADVVATATGPVVPEAIDKPEGESSVSEANAEPRDADVVGAATGPVAPEAAEAAAEADSTRRTG